MGSVPGRFRSLCGFLCAKKWWDQLIPAFFLIYRPPSWASVAGVRPAEPRSTKCWDVVFPLTWYFAHRNAPAPEHHREF